ncbi:Uncharacterized damage-inducible protein DinB (forms a four-helix bundle) [Pseudorhodobacter antarcticus]|jgi:uncharacterized damage-inducible protein DinB|uniref:Uncharacterized damage-inducible protein DinB (Forms a four-helix bundle) n=1 Tax=Pseudorhodobacter antarcticus TaxID=1077947 RepID=A0A1H8CC12_9RHOB|nr:DinB family protein [Pseudorhodobacter antarcticus]SEM92502.1 Uncharacterized damage-inducible protein DinB (forms a four-helix bundle) [Pseudorhodobacter antarcticus]
MPNAEYAVAMARYNMWQNENLVEAAGGLDDGARQLARGAFFGSIEATFAHVLWGDQMWMHRFAATGLPAATTIPGSVDMGMGWDAFCAARVVFDGRILDWAHGVDAVWFDGDLTWYSGALGRDVTKPKGLLVLQLFNHQTHHRGQIHAMLTAAGAKPGDTDVPFMPARFDAL